MSKMSPEALKAVAKKHGGYANPKLNDVLYLHCQGFIDIENLEPYTDVKVLWLEQNAIETIKGLDGNTQLVTLFLQNNAIRKITGLECLANLRILNLSHNYITEISHIAACCPLLESLQISHNQIESLEGCAELQQMRHLSSVDLSYNKLSRPEGAGDTYVFDFFSQMPAIAVLYLQGQPLSIGVKNYRKNMVWNIKTLTYLDERPVFADERRAVEAWGVGGNAAESAEREAIRKEKHDHLTGCVQTLIDMAEKMKDVREARTIEWERQKEAERKRQAENIAARREVDFDEEDARVIITTDESGEWVDLVDVLGKALLVAEEEDEARQTERAERAALEAVATMEIAREEATLEALVEAAESATEAVERSQRRGEIAYWVKQMELSEEDIITQMEDEMTEMLKMMRPAGGYRDITAMAASAVAAAPVAASSSSSLTTSPSKSAMREEKNKHIDPTAADADGAAVAGTEAADGATAAPSPAAGAVKRRPKFSKERVWAQYDAWESLQSAARRSTKKPTADV